MDSEPTDEPEFKNISNIRIKIGPIEIEYKGREDFLKGELEGLLLTVLNAYKEAGIPLESFESAKNFKLDKEIKAKDAITFTTSTIAGKMGVNSGPGLILAACAHLTLAKGKESFTRKEIIEEMNNAKPYLKKSYISNLSKTLTNLVKSNKISETGREIYTLTAQTRKEMEQLLAN